MSITIILPHGSGSRLWAVSRNRVRNPMPPGIKVRSYEHLREDDVRA